MNRRKRIVLLSYLLAFTIVLSGCKWNVDNPEQEEPKIVDETEEPSNLPDDQEETDQGPADIQPEADFSNVVNMSDFDYLTEEQKSRLLQNRFFVSETEHKQLFYIYENNEYRDIPSFITTDSVLHTYHIFYDYLLRTIENEKLLGLAEELTEEMLMKSIEAYNDVDDPALRIVLIKNLAYYSVANMLLQNELPNGIPEESLAMANKEFSKIENQEGFTYSAIFPFQMDYSQYIPRGHYTRSEDLERYFLAMMWYGQVPFPLYKNEEERNEEQTLQAILISRMISDDQELLQKWEQIYEPTNFFVGSSDDLGIKEYSQAVDEIYGEDSGYNVFSDNGLLDEFYERSKEFPAPRIVARYADIDTPVDKQFRFMGQRYVFDSQIIQELVYPILRPIPSGMDVMAVLGSDRAKEIQLENPDNQQWEDYPKEMERLRTEFSGYEEKDWKRNLYTGWMWVLDGLLGPAEDTMPEFMKNQAWEDKNLNTALSSWAELKHDTVLYGKASGAEMGGAEYVRVPGYVEPNIPVYERLLWLTDYSRDALMEWDLEIDEIDYKLERFQWLLQFLIDASEKQLKDIPLTEEEHDRIKIYGGILEDLTSSFAGQGTKWHEITSETDKDMAVIADYHTVGRDGVMVAGVGPAYEIYVLTPIDGELYLTRGAVMSFHEFFSEKRLTDEEWQKMIVDGTNPPMQKWTESFIK
ncbi:DUF3160 domain-containing protein [Gudongella sp. DL1XJH-153]|uniref:DUF3160 domain-containing protein n=1 Tax=Gudongella sp. DL1XJH-153 TaxID=3409804 RepID=UPI003BB5D58D